MNSPKRGGADPRQGTGPENLNSARQDKYTQLSDKEALKIIYSLIEADNVRKYPNNPYPLRAKPYNLKKTGDITKAVIKWIQLHAGQAERISSTGRYIDDSITSTNVMGQTVKIGSGKWIPGTSTNGTADISAILKNPDGIAIPLKIELKNAATRDRIRQKQIEYKRQVEAAGGVYLVVKTFSGFVQWYYDFMGGQSHE